MNFNIRKLYKSNNDWEKEKKKRKRKKKEKRAVYSKTLIEIDNLRISLAA